MNFKKKITNRNSRNQRVDLGTTKKRIRKYEEGFEEIT